MLNQEKKEIKAKLDNIGNNFPQEDEIQLNDIQDQISMLKLEENMYSKQLEKLSNIFIGTAVSSSHQ
jgi:hypothetical protein